MQSLRALQFFENDYLLYREDRESFECWPSSKTIGTALHMSKDTVLKYVHRLEEKDYIMAEPTQVQRRDGSKWNGNLKYHIRPIQSVIKRYNDAQMKKRVRSRSVSVLKVLQKSSTV